MRRDWDFLRAVHAKTDGRCHLCSRDVALRSYGRKWECDHSRARARRGTDHLNNIYPACIPCNRSKGAGSTRAFRRRNGLTRAPMSADERFGAQLAQTVGLGFAGILIGKALHPNGAKLGALAGSVLGVVLDPEG